MMHGIFLPGWDSLDSVQHIHAVLELAALLFFAFLVLADIFEHLATDKKAKRYKVVGLVFFGLAILTELIAYPYSRRNDRLSQDRIHTQELAMAGLNKEAGEARRDANQAKAQSDSFQAAIANANARVKSADAQIASANAASHDAVVKVAKAEARIAEANRTAAEANRIAEDEKLSRVKLEKQIAPRTLSDVDRIAIAKELRIFAPSLAGRKVIVSSYSGDAEGVIFSLEICDILTRAGIAIDPVIGRTIQAGIVTMGVKATSPLADREFITSLVTKIHERLDTSLSANWGPQFGDITIMVGVKPVSGLATINEPKTK